MEAAIPICRLIKTGTLRPHIIGHETKKDITMLNGKFSLMKTLKYSVGVMRSYVSYDKGSKRVMTSPSWPFLTTMRPQ